MIHEDEGGAESSLPPKKQKLLERRWVSWGPGGDGGASAPSAAMLSNVEQNRAATPVVPLRRSCLAQCISRNCALSSSHSAEASAG